MDISVYLAELFGTMILVLLGDGCVNHAVLKKSKGSGSDWIVIAAGWGMAVTVAVYVVGWKSGAHINPAVTIALATIGSFGWDQVFGYIVAQMIGAMLGAFLVYLTYREQLHAEDNSDSILACFSTGPSIRNTFWNLMSEAIGTAMLLIGVLGIGKAFEQSAQGDVSTLAPLLVGGVVFAIGLSLGGATGYAINPARDLGPRIMHALLPIPNKGKSDWSYGLLVPIVGPIIGGIIGALVFGLFM